LPIALHSWYQRKNYLVWLIKITSLINSSVAFRSIIFSILFISQTALAQSKSSEGITTAVYLSGALGKKIDYEISNTSNFVVLDKEIPNSGNNTGFYKLYSDAGLNYKVSRHFSFGANYAYERVHVTDKNHTDENRIVVQATYRQLLKSISLRYRVKFEDRFIHHALTHVTDQSTRLKLLTGTNIPIRSPGKNIYFSAYEELYLLTYHNSPYTFSENRLYMGGGYKVSKKTSIETGILYNPKRLNKADWYHQYYLQFTLISRADLFHEKN
jgi:hypothetical protein